MQVTHWKDTFRRRRMKDSWQGRERKLSKVLSWLKFSCNLVSRACAQIAWQIRVPFLPWNATFCVPGSCLTSTYWGVAVASDVVGMRLTPTRILALLSQKKLMRGPRGNSGKAVLGLLLQQGGVRTSNRFPCSLFHKVGRAVSLGRVRVGVCPGVRQEGWLRWFAHP